MFHVHLSITVVNGNRIYGSRRAFRLRPRPIRLSVQDVNRKLTDLCFQGPAHPSRMHQWERRKVREVNGLLAAEGTAAVAVFVVVVVIVAVERDDNWRTEGEKGVTMATTTPLD